MKNIILKSCLIALCLICGLGNAWGETYSFTPNNATTGNNATAYVTSAYSFTYNNIGWSFNQWNPSTLQIKTNQTSVTSEFNFQNTSAFPGKITSVVITFKALTVSDASKLCFVGGSSAISSLSGGTAGTWNSTAKTLTWTPASTDNFTYFAFYQNGKAASGTNYLASADAIVVTYESVTPTKTLSSIAVKTAPTKTTYTEGENFDPAGLVITATYSDSDPEDIAYSGNESDFSFSPTLTTALTTSNTYVTITYGGKSTAQSITVNEKPKHTAYFSINGTINDAYDCTVTEGSAITFPTGLADINGKKFVGWMEGTISGTADTAPDFVTSATMGTADITYNAVYATQTGSGEAQTTLVNSTDGLVAGNTYYIAASATYAGTTVVMGKNTGGNNFPATAFSAEPLALTLGGNATDGWTFSYTDGGPTYYLDPTSTTGSNYLKQNTSVTEYGKFSISFSSNAAVITSKGKTSRHILRYNSTSTCFSCYSSGQSPVYLFTESGGTTYSGYCTTVTTSGPTDATWSVEPASVSVEVDKTATATISTDYDGTLSVSSNATGTATATISDKTITVTGVAAGTTTLTVTGAATSNFNAISKTIDVTVTASSATTPAFAYFEETATINIGEVLEAKGYCGTIAPDAGFDEYSISTAVCSAIGAADGQKISDDYACIYSKVSFKKAGTYVVHVTAPAVTGKYTASEGYITVTVTGPTLYKVTIETPENGTLIVKHGDDTVESGDEFAKDEKLDITVTPDEGYKFRNWQAVDNTTHTYTTTFKYIIGESDVTISANFDELATYAINFSINGNIATQNLKEGADVTVPTAEEVNAARPTGVTKVFTGWVTSEESVDANETPTYVIPATTAINNITYYAVFATKTGEGEGEGGDYKLVEEDLGTAWAGQYLIAYSNDVFANGKVGGTSGLGKAQSHVAPGEALSSDNKTVATEWGNQYYVTLEEISPNSNTYVLKTQDNVYNYQTKNNNGLASSENKSTAAAYPISITFNESNDIDLALGGNATGAVFHYNNNSGTSGEMFRFYKDGGQQNIYLYKKSATTGGATYSYFTTLVSCEISISQYGATSFSVPRNYTMPTGITGKTITANKKVDSLGDGYYKLTYSADYEEGSVVPAGESLVLYGEQGNYTIIYEGTPEKTLKEGNLLHGVYEAKDGKFLTTYDKENSGSYYYYKLTTQSGKNFGWYYGATEGAPFLMSRDDRAYLVIEKEIAAGIRGFALEDGEEEDLTTGIDNMETNSTNSIYNLQGLQQSKLQKGINIVNGKKVIR